MVGSEIISYTDDDVLFYPGWLDKAIDLIDLWPADLVTGSPILTRFKWYDKQRERFEDDPDIKVEDLSWKKYPKDWLEDDALGRGLDLKGYERLIEKSKEGEIRPFRAHQDGLSAWGVCHHMQFTGRRLALLETLPEPGRELMGVMREWDVAMDLVGMTQLATAERSTRHMGNVMDNSIVSDAIKMELVI
jgi:hypothetical protein